jgi:hypothetical protein
VQRRAQDAPVIDAAVLVEPVVLDGQHGLLHDVRDVLEVHERTAFLAEFADQDVIGGEDPQRHLGPVIGQGVECRQVRVGHQQRERHHQHAAQGEAGQAGEHGQQDASRAALRAVFRFGLAWRRLGRRRSLVRRCFHADAGFAGWIEWIISQPVGTDVWSREQQVWRCWQDSFHTE